MLSASESEPAAGAVGQCFQDPGRSSGSLFTAAVRAKAARFAAAVDRAESRGVSAVSLLKGSARASEWSPERCSGLF